ncbi:MAG: type VI secretion protein [Ruminococcus sp.]|uniref:VirB4 family type IV secretion system protein n=1 Tax=Ruminococcus sp. TaxID=41978 RepID=UPI002873312C|nr:type VI secretion protein [Ruminococcus sp.]MBQ3286097.1 type VI secretion protein [Ruminococcus sp.]
MITLLIIAIVMCITTAAAFLVMYLIKRNSKKTAKKKTSAKAAEKKTNKQIKKNNDSVQNLLGIKSIEEDHILTTEGQELYYINIPPKNLTVLSQSEQDGFVEAISNIMIQAESVEFVCTDGAQNYEDNLQYLNTLVKTENNPYIRDLNIKDEEYLDNIRINTATSRAFYLLLRISENETPINKKHILSSTIQICNENKLGVTLVKKEDLKRLAAIYLEQNPFSNHFADYDGEEYVHASEINEEYYKGFVDVVCPSVAVFKQPNYYVIGNTFRSVIALREYQTLTDQRAILKEFGEKEGVTLHIYARRLNSVETNKVIDNSEINSKSKIIGAKKLREQVDGVEDIDDIKKYITNKRSSNQSLFAVAVFIETSAKSLDDLKSLNDTIAQTLTSLRLVCDKLHFQQRDGFTSVMPWGKKAFKRIFDRFMPSISAANLFPFSYSGKTDPRGFILGKDVNGGYILTDFDRRDFDKTNGHISVFGNSGEGKSWIIKLFICIFRQKKKSLYSLDVDSEFNDVTDNLGGTNVDMMSGKYIINVLQPKLLKDIEEDASDYDTFTPSAVQKNTQLAQHIAFLRDFFSVYKPELTSLQLDILEIMLVRTYEKFNITNDSNLLKLSAEDFPILSDLYKVVEEELNEYADKALKNPREMLYSKENLRDLALSINSICVGNDSLYFNGYTNIPNAEHINFDINEMLNTNENLKNAMYLNIFSFMQHKYFTQGNTVVICDEIHEIIKSMIVVSYIRSFVKRGRKRDSNILTSSQNIEDLMLPGIVELTTPLFSIPTHRFLFFPGTVDIEKYKRITNITDSEYSLISTPHRGFCLYSCGEERYHLHVIAPEHKAELFGTAGGR